VTAWPFWSVSRKPGAGVSSCVLPPSMASARIGSAVLFTAADAIGAAPSTTTASAATAATDCALAAETDRPTAGPTSDCPIIGLEFKETGILLGSQDKNVVLVAIVANPTYRSVAFTRAFDREDGLGAVPNWLYLTGSLSQLSQVWRDYGVSVQNLPAGAMAAHNDLAIVIDKAGNIREEVGADPGPATTSTQSSFSVLLSDYARQALSP